MVFFRNMVARVSRRDRIAARIYAHCVDAARAPQHFGADRVPDSVDGRFDMLALHLFIVARRLQEAGPEGRAMVQSLIDCFVRDMDHNLREMGAGDVGVARRVRQMAQALNGLLHGYDQAMRDGPEAFLERLLRNVLAVPAGPGEADTSATRAQRETAGRLAGYVRVQMDRLSSYSDADCLSGRCRMEPAADIYCDDAAPEDGRTA